MLPDSDYERPAANSANVKLMVKVGAFALLVTAVSFGQDCLPQGKPVTIRGRLVLVNERGYRRWIGLRPTRPICALADPDVQYSYRTSRVSVVQTFDAEQAGIRSRLNRLVGKDALLTGKLTQWLTGYHRTDVVLEVRTVGPLDAGGEAALRAPEPPPPVLRDVAAYDVLVQAGRKLAIGVHEAGTNRSLEPADEYAPHHMTGSDDVLWISCRDGYEIRSSYVAPPSVGDCESVQNTCGLLLPPHKVLTLKMRCVKETPSPGSGR